MDPSLLYLEISLSLFHWYWTLELLRPVSGYSLDFVGTMLIPKTHLRLGGIASGLNVEGLGNVKWTFLADDGHLLTLNLRAYFVPACKQQLLSPQKIFSKDQGITGSFVITEDYACLLINDSLVLTISYNPVKELPTSRAICSEFADSHSVSLNLCVTEASNQNLSFRGPEGAPALALLFGTS
jgi:hypothetical protein